LYIVIQTETHSILVWNLHVLI